MSLEKDIEKALKDRKALLGSRSVLSAARLGRIESLIYANNVPKRTISDIRHFSGISGFKTHEFSGNSLELGELCGKPFSVLVLGITK